MTSHSARPGLLRLGASLSSAFLLIAMPAPAFASGTGVINGALNAKPNGVRLAQMGEMGGKMTGNPKGSDNKPGGMGGGMGDKMSCCMGMMGAAPGADTAGAMPSALPGFPGASHLYHVGSTGFFLDYADKIGLSAEQKTALNGIKQRTLTEQSASGRKVAEAEQALWALTAVEQPDAAAIDGKVREIEKLKSDQRLAFIRSVGEAAKLLTAAAKDGSRHGSDAAGCGDAQHKIGMPIRTNALHGGSDSRCTASSPFMRPKVTVGQSPTAVIATVRLGVAERRCAGSTQTSVPCSADRRRRIAPVPLVLPDGPSGCTSPPGPGTWRA